MAIIYELAEFLQFFLYKSLFALSGRKKRKTNKQTNYYETQGSLKPPISRLLTKGRRKSHLTIENNHWKLAMLHDQPVVFTTYILMLELK